MPELAKESLLASHEIGANWRQRVEVRIEMHSRACGKDREPSCQPSACNSRRSHPVLLDEANPFRAVALSEGGWLPHFAHEHD